MSEPEVRQHHAKHLGGDRTAPLLERAREGGGRDNIVKFNQSNSIMADTKRIGGSFNREASIW